MQKTQKKILGGLWASTSYGPGHRHCGMSLTVRKSNFTLVLRKLKKAWLTVYVSAYHEVS